MNASRLYTLLLQQRGMQGVFSVGRVQTATLYLLYKRQREIEEFVSHPYFTFQGEATINNDSFDVKHKQRFKTKEEAQKLLQEKEIGRASCRERVKIWVGVVREKKKRKIQG